VYVCEGFCEVLVLPSPNDQLQLVGVFVELSVNATVNGAVPEEGVPVKLATGLTDCCLIKAISEVEPLQFSKRIISPEASSSADLSPGPSPVPSVTSPPVLFRRIVSEVSLCDGQLLPFAEKAVRWRSSKLP
jgi:hypothetical protein